MTRMRILSREDMNDEQGMLYDSFVEDGKPHAGPYWAYVRHPSLMQLCSDIGDWFRGSALSGRERQIAVLTTVRFWDANYPWVRCARRWRQGWIRTPSMPSTNAAIPV